MEIKDVEITIYVKTKRIIAGMKLEDLAAKTGISKSQLSDIERGKKMPSFIFMYKISKALDASLYDLFEEKDERFELMRKWMRENPL